MIVIVLHYTQHWQLYVVATLEASLSLLSKLAKPLCALSLTVLMLDEPVQLIKPAILFTKIDLTGQLMD